MDGLKINSLQHVGIPVARIDVSERFYNSLGFHKIMEAPFAHPDGEGKAIMMQLEAIVIELYQFPEAALNEIRSRKDGSIDHIAFDVSDIDAAFELLKAAGFAVIEEQPVFLAFWKNGCKYFNITGPDGERLEFNQLL